MVEAARILEAALGARPSHMAYPYGYAEAVGAARWNWPGRGRLHLGGDHAPRRIAGRARRGISMRLPRISVNGRYQELGYIRTMLSGITTPLANRGRTLVTV